MRRLAVPLLCCAALAAHHAAFSQEPVPASEDDYVCAFAGDCGDAAGAAPDATPAGRPRISATRGFALSPSATPAPAPRPARASGQRVNLSLSFETASARLTPEAEGRARVFARALLLPRLAGMRFRIEGHTDAVGSRARNLSLSQRRAQSVADFLVSLGVPRGRLDVRGYGPDRPMPGTGRESARNRRVEAVRLS